jgi:hypothetical protein
VYILDVLEEVGWTVYPSDVAHMFEEVVRGSRVHGIAIAEKKNEWGAILS